jgi:hypothetical protein
MRLRSVYGELMPFIIAQPMRPNYGGKAYTYTCRIERDPDAPKVTVESLQAYLQSLKERMRMRYGEEVASLFYLSRRTIDGKTYIILGRKRRSVGGLRATDRLPIYFDAETGEAYIPESYARRNPRRTRYLLMTVLGALKQTRRTFLGRKGS